MITPVVVAVAAWMLLTGTGLAVLAALPRDARERLLPAAPVLGVALVVVVLSLTTAVLSVEAGLLLLLPVLLVLAGVARKRPDRGFPPPRRAACLLLVPVLAGLPPFAAALVPSLAHDGALVLPTSNHDGYYYVGVTEWLTHSSGLREPRLGVAPSEGEPTPFDASALRHVTQHLRLGEPLVQAAVNTLFRLQAETSWYALTCLWLLLVPAGVVAAAGLLRLPLLPAGLLAAVVAASPLVLRQAYNQNSASLLGIALAPLALVAVAEVLGSRSRLPAWAAALLVAAWLGTYTEYAVLAAPSVLLVLFSRRPRDLLPAAGRAVRLGLLVLLGAPLVWYNAVRSLLFLAGLPESPWSSPFLGPPWDLVVARATGAVALDAPSTGRLLPALLVLALVTGLAVAVLQGPARRVWLALTVSTAAALLHLSVLAPSPYAQQRLVEIGVPLVLVAAGAGWCTLADRARSRRALFVALLPALLWVGAGWRTDVGLLTKALERPRPVDPTFREAAGWVRELGGPQGRDVSVLAGSFFDQLWAVEALRQEELVAYPRLDPRYRVREQFWDGAVDRYLLVDAAAYVDAPGAVVVRSNHRFRLLDVTGRAFVAGVTVGYSAGRWFDPEPGPATWMKDGGQLFVLHRGVSGVQLELAPNPDLPPLPLVVSGGSRDVGTAVRAPASALTVPLSSATNGTLLTLDNRITARAAVSAGDPRPLSVRLVGMRRAL